MAELITFESNYKNMLKGKKSSFINQKSKYCTIAIASAGIAIVTLYVVFRRGD
jgi:hypothetical protein